MPKETLSGMEIPNSGDQYNLKWTHHLSNFIQTFIEHQHGESLVDVTLCCEGKYIKAHKLILSACSDYFHSIFQVHSSMQHPIILLNNVRFMDLSYILHFMYHGEVKVMDKDLPSVLALGETLQIKGLSSVKMRDVPPDRAVPQNTLPLKSTEESQKKKPIAIANTPFDYSQPKSGQISDKSTKKLVKMIPLCKKTENDKVKTNGVSSSNQKTSSASSAIQKVNQKAPHAFIFFANEWRKKLTIEHPEESSKEISIRLSNMWKSLLPSVKESYYQEAIQEEEKIQLQNASTNIHKRKSDDSGDSKPVKKSSSMGPSMCLDIQEIALSDSD